MSNATPLYPPMDRPGHILITGLTGSVGAEIVRCLPSRAPGFQVTAVLRAGSSEELTARWSRILLAARMPTAELRDDRLSWRPLAGDITLPGLGLSDAEMAELSDSVTHVIHAAADVRFLAPLTDLRQVNVAGTANVLEMAVRFRRLVQCAYVSTLFVAGRRTGMILEHELEHDAGFINNYEQSKYEAELVAKSFMKVLPLATYRLALLPGRRTDGFVHQFGAFHQILNFYHQGVLQRLPGTPGNLLDIIPTDWAADILVHAFLAHFEAGRTFHVCSGASAVRMSEFVELTSRVFSGNGEPARHPALAPLTLVDPSRYDRSLDGMTGDGSARSRQIARLLQRTAPYGAISRVFDRNGLHRSLPEKYAAPAFRDYYPRIARYCVAEKWRKH